MNNRHVTLFSAAHGKTLKEYETEFSMDAPAAAPELPQEPHIVVPQQVLEVRQSCFLMMRGIICMYQGFGSAFFFFADPDPGKNLHAD